MNLVPYGLNRGFMLLVGFVELFGAVAIWFSGSYWGALSEGIRLRRMGKFRSVLP
jgi:hypothetical protein